jgi:hypothetical protein
MTGFGFIEKNTSVIFVVGWIFLYGVVASIQFSAMNILAYVDLDGSNLSKGTSIASTFQQLSACFAVAIAALLIKYFLGFGHKLLSGDVMPLHYTFFVIGFITMLSTCMFLKLKEEDGLAVSGYKGK